MYPHKSEANLKQPPTELWGVPLTRRTPLPPPGPSDVGMARRTARGCRRRASLVLAAATAGLVVLSAIPLTGRGVVSAWGNDAQARSYFATRYVENPREVPGLAGLGETIDEPVHDYQYIEGIESP